MRALIHLAHVEHPGERDADHLAAIVATHDRATILLPFWSVLTTRLALSQPRAAGMPDGPGAVTAPGGDRAALVIDEARAWLRHVLAAGPRPAHDLRCEATAHAIVEKALYAALKREGITACKARIPHGRWFWMFATAAGELEESDLPSS